MQEDQRTLQPRNLRHRFGVAIAHGSHIGQHTFDESRVSLLVTRQPGREAHKAGSTAGGYQVQIGRMDFSIGEETLEVRLIFGRVGKEIGQGRPVGPGERESRQ